MLAKPAYSLVEWTHDQYYKGDRKKAADALPSRGWQFLRQGNKADAHAALHSIMVD